METTFTQEELDQLNTRLTGATAGLEDILADILGETETA